MEYPNIYIANLPQWNNCFPHTVYVLCYKLKLLSHPDILMIIDIILYDYIELTGIGNHWAIDNQST